MSLTVQNLRAVGTGVEPASLLPGQIAFNITDKVMYVGDGSSFKTDFEGNQVAGTPGAGWYAMPMDFGALGDYYVANPEVYGDVPTDQQVLTWSTALNHPLWTTGSGGGGNQVYVVTNAQVASASGATTSDKITTAIGVASPDEGDVTIVTGLPDDVYEGLYFFTTSWVKGAAYAYPSASEVIYNNTGRTIGATVQAAISDLDDGLIATTAIANTANSTANSALSIASAALPRAGGVMTGNITFQDAGEGVVFNGGSSIFAVSDSVSTTSSTTAASSTAVKTAYDLAAAAVPRSSFVSSGDLLVGTGTGTFTPLPAGAADYILASDGAGNLLWVPDSEGDVTGVSATAPITVDNTDPQVPVIGVDLATTATPGVVQIELTGNLTLVGGVINVPNASTAVKGAVQLNNTLSSTSTTLALTAAQGKALQDQIDALTLSNSVTLAGGYNATTGLVDGATSQGISAGFVDGNPPPAPAPGNADYYLICTTSGSNPSAMGNGDWLLSDGTQYVVLGVGARPASASYTTAGIVQLADAAAVLAGTSDTTAITPQALQDNVIDSVTTANSSQIASATAVKTAYDAAVAAQTTATAALPKAGGTMTGNVTFQDVGEGVIFSNLSSVVAISDSVSTASATTAASSTAVKDAYDAGIQGQTDAAAAQADADQALLDAAAAQTDATQALADAATAQADADQALLDAAAAQATADAAIPDATFTAAGEMIYGTASGTYSVLPIGSANQLLTVSGGLPVWASAPVQLQGYTCTATPFNTALGQGAGDSVTTGVSNTSLGYNAGTAITGGSSNTVVGFNAGDALAGASNNTAIGVNALGTNISGTSNVAIGSSSLQASLCCQNTAVGNGSGCSVTIGIGHVYVGFLAGANSTSACNNTAVGWNALSQSTAGSTTAVGFAALQNNTTGTQNTAVGFSALSTSTSASNNTALGYRAGVAISGGGNNTLVGTNTGASLGTGSSNTLVGNSSGSAITTGACNTLVGGYTGTTTLANNIVLSDGAGAIRFQANASGAWSYNGTDFGTAGQFLTSQGSAATPIWCTLSLACIPCAAFVACGDLLVGTGSATFTALPTGTNGQNLVVDTTCTATGGLKWVTTPQLCGFTCTATPFNTALGSLAGAALTNLSVANTAIGYSALDSETSGDFNVAVGHNALTAQNGASGNVAIGGNAGAQVTNGGNNILIGCNAGDVITTGSDNIAIGGNAGGAATSGVQSVFIGSNAGLVANATGVTAIGFCAAQATTTSGCTTYVGWVSGRNATGLSNTYVGALTGCAASNTSACGTFLGFCSGSAVTTGNGNNFIGFQAGRNVNTGGFNVAIGTAAFQTATTATNNVAVGCGALAGLSTTAGNTALGHRAMINASTAANNVVIGCSAGEQISTGSTNVFIGNTAGDAVTTGSSNTIIGDIAGSAALADNLILAAGATIKLQVNENGAVGVGTTPGYGTAGQVLTSGGTGAAPTWAAPTWQNLTTLTTTSTASTTLLSVSAAAFRGGIINVSVSNATGGDFHTDILQVNHNGTTANLDVTAGAHIGAAPYTASAAITGGNLVVSVASASANSTKYVGNYMTFEI